MPSTRRSARGQPKVYIDVDGPWSPSVTVYKNTAKVTSEPAGINTGGSPERTPYSRCKVDVDWSEEEEGMMSSDGDFLSSSDEYQPESETESEGMDKDGELWEDSDSDVGSIKVEPDSDADVCEDRVMYPRPRASRKPFGTSPKEDSAASFSDQQDKAHVVRVKRVVKIDGRRLYNKKLSCYYCNRLFQYRIWNHLQRRHKNEPLVAQASAKLSKKERDVLMNEIKNLGNFKHNIRVIKRGKGQLIVARRPTKNSLKPRDLLPCVHCYGFFHGKELWRHSKNCPSKRTMSHSEECSSKDTLSIEKKVKTRSRLLLAGGLESDMDGLASLPKELRRIVSRSKRLHDVRCAVVDDPLIIQFGSVLIKRLGPSRSRYVLQKMRQLARLKMQLNTLVNENRSLEYYISPKHFGLIVKAVHELAGFHENEQKNPVFKTPTLALSIGHSLVKVAEMRKGKAIRKMDDFMRRDCEEFLAIHCPDWTPAVTAQALAKLQADKSSKPLALPITSDLVLLKNYLDDQITVLTTDLEKHGERVALWTKLAETTMTRIVLFNKSSEVSKLLCNSFTNRKNREETANDEIASDLKPIEKVLLKRLQVVETQGKQNKRCPVLLTETMVMALDCLMKHREMCGIASGNPFMFASTTSEDHHLTSTTSEDHHLTNTTSEDHHLASTTSEDHHLASTTSEDHRLASTTSEDHRLASTTSEDHHLANTTSEDLHMDPWTSMNKLAKEAGCKQPNLMSSSTLGKYLATVCQILDLEDHEFECVSRHLAHNIHTHTQQHDATVKLAKVGGLVMAAMEGQLAKYAGKERSDMDVSELVLPLEDSEKDVALDDEICELVRPLEDSEKDVALDEICELVRPLEDSEKDVALDEICDQIARNTEEAKSDQEDDVRHSHQQQHQLDQATPEQTTHQARSEQTADQARSEQTADQARPEQTTRQARSEQTADQARPEQTADQARPEQTADQARPEQTADQARPEQTADQARPEQTVDQARSEQTADQARPEQTAGYKDLSIKGNEQVNRKKKRSLDSDTIQDLCDEDGLVPTKEDSNKAEKSKIPTKRRRWTKDEEQVLRVEFQKHIKEKSIPRNAEAQKVKNKYRFLSDRNIHQIKSKVQHLISK